MCGILMIHGDQSIDPGRLDYALTLLSQRGPDFTRYHHSDRLLIAHSVLHITGDRQWYQSAHRDFLAYNGEIYNFKDLGRYTNDIELIHDQIRNHRYGWKDIQGPWSWLYFDGRHIRYASDPQGEHFLYRYRDKDHTIVASEVAVILALKDCGMRDVPYENKCWSMHSETPWEGINRLDPGVLYKDHQRYAVLDDIWQWVHVDQNKSDQDWQQEFSAVLETVTQQMQTKISSTISFSGGVDSGILSRCFSQSNLLTIDMVGKDPNVTKSWQLLSEDQMSRQDLITVHPQQYAEEYDLLLERTKMPAQSWSFVGKWLVAKHAKTPIIYTGLAADELFGGYQHCLSLEKTNASPLSAYSQHYDPDLWEASMSVYQGDARPATLLMDYWYQVVGVDSPGQDRIGGAWGRETRNPFMHPLMMRLALNLPWHLRVNTNKTKILLREYFLTIWKEDLLWPKQGFAGHANDSLPWLNVPIRSTGDRHRDWIQIARNSFYKNSH